MDEEPIAPLSINKYDQYSLKAGLDECITALLEERGFKEDNKWMDIKILVVLGQLGVTVIGQLYKPDESWYFLNNKPFQCLLIALYVGLFGVYYFIDTWILAEEFFSSQDHPVSSAF